MGRPDGRLTVLREVFLREYLIDKNGKAAAIRAGYSPKSAAKTASEILSQPTSKRILAQMLKEQAERVLISADQVLLDIDRIADRAYTQGEFNAAIRGKELLGKHFKLFTEKHEHGGLGGGPVQLQITDSEANL